MKTFSKYENASYYEFPSGEEMITNNGYLDLTFRVLTLGNNSKTEGTAFISLTWWEPFMSVSC